MITLTPQNFIALMEDRGYPVLTEEVFKPYHLNIIGYRNRFGRVNYFDDTISVYFQKDGKWVQHDFPATTLPGSPSLLKPMSLKGSAILKPGQYKYALGMHKGKYPALVQNGPVTVYRDNNRNLLYDLDRRTEETGLFGINIHKASLGAKIVGSESYGCQVIKEGFDRFMSLINSSLRYRDNKFTYTLVDI